MHRYGSKLEKRLERARTKAEEVPAFVAALTQDQVALAHDAGNAGVPEDLQEDIEALRRPMAGPDASRSRIIAMPERHCAMLARLEERMEDQPCPHAPRS